MACSDLRAKYSPCQRSAILKYRLCNFNSWLISNIDINTPFSFSGLDSETAPDCEERILHQDMTRQIVRCLSEAKESSLRCRILLLPRTLTANVALDVVRSSAGEPCGLRGAFIQVYLETQLGQQLQMLGTITPDPTVTPTFELSVVFKLDKDRWPLLKHIFVTDKVLKLRPQYRLVKKKLYSSASPVIHEFC